MEERKCPGCGEVLVRRQAGNWRQREYPSEFAKRIFCGRECSLASQRVPGSSASPIYTCWQAIRGRCYNPAFTGFKYYGGRGIQVCERWRTSFRAFADDMGPKPSPKHSIDRIDNDGDYEPGNCRWATRRQQNGNRRISVRVTCGDRTECIKEWSRITGRPPETIRQRLLRGHTPEEAFS